MNPSDTRLLVDVCIVGALLSVVCVVCVGAHAVGGGPEVTAAAAAAAARRPGPIPGRPAFSGRESVTEINQHSISLAGHCDCTIVMAQKDNTDWDVAKKFTKASLASIGSQIGKRDHATVLHACKTVDNLAETDKQFRKYIDDLTKKFS